MRAITLLSVLYLTLGVLDSATAQPLSSPYDFPIKPGTPKWNSLSSFSERLAVCQIPQDLLQRMTTEALVETCLDYPHFESFIFYEDSLGGMGTVVAGFNGLQELIHRKDAGSVLLRKYQEYDPRGYDKNWPLAKQGRYATLLGGLELLLGDYSILSNLRPDERRALLAVAVERSRAKLQDHDNYALLDVQKSAWLAGRVMVTENFDEYLKTLGDNNRLSYPIARRDFLDTLGINATLRHADTFIGNNR